MIVPHAIAEVLSQALVAILNIKKGDGEIISHPILPLYENNKIYFTSSILFSKKIEAIRKNNKVSLFINDEAGIKKKEYFPILIKGIARIDDSDIHYKWMKLLHLWKAKKPYIINYIKQRFALPLFWERVIVEIEPLKIYAWKGDINKPPVIFE
jgi:nitroimidazol reductase NimA-like FMN-containing flavoprotein (pyridoxamine 5'-phosphate oxidase superfamily)